MQIEKIRIGDLILNEKNIRKDLNVDDLIDSIQESGVLVPLIVTPDNVVIDGNRRLEAARQVFGNNAVITVEVKDLSEQEIIEYALITALQRESLTEKDKAGAYQQLNLLGLSDLAIAKKIGKKKTDVKAYVKAADASETAWENHTLEELVYIAEYPELEQYSGKSLIDRYDRLVAKDKFNAWLEEFALPINTTLSETEKWYDNKRHSNDGLVIKQDNKLYQHGQVVADDYTNYPYAPNSLIQVVSNELWVLEPKEETDALNGKSHFIEDIEVEDESDKYSEYLEVWGGIVERVKREISQLTITKEPNLTLVNLVCSAYGYGNLKEMALDSFDSVTFEPFYMMNGKVVHRECEAFGFIDALTTLSEKEKEVIGI